MYIQPVVIAE